MKGALAVVALMAACGKDGKATGGSSEADSAGCRPIKLCDAIPSAKIDAMCGTKTAKASPTDGVGVVTHDQCIYYNSNGDNLITIARTCFGPTLDDKSVTDVFEGQARAIQDEAKSELPGLGVQAYYFVSKTYHYARLETREGRVMIHVNNNGVTADNEATQKTGCMIALYNAIAAK